MVVLRTLRRARTSWSRILATSSPAPQAPTSPVSALMHATTRGSESDTSSTRPAGTAYETHAAEGDLQSVRGVCKGVVFQPPVFFRSFGAVYQSVYVLLKGGKARPPRITYLLLRTMRTLPEASERKQNLKQP